MVTETPLAIDVDVAADIAYILVVKPRRPISRTLALDLDEIAGDINLDLDEDGRLIGIEVIGAARVLPRDLVARWGMSPGPLATKE